IQIYIVTDGKDLFKLFPMISDWNRYIIADLHLNKGDYIEGSPIVFDDVVEARAYVMSRFVADDEEKKIFMTTDDVPSTIGADTIFSNDSDLMKLFLSDIEDKTETVNEMLSEEFILNEAIKISDKRTDIQDTIMKVFDKLDKSGKNSEKLKNFYNTMNNEEFIRYMKRFVNSDENFYLEVLPNKNEPKLKDVEEALEAINVPTNEYVYYQHDGDKNNPIRTRYQVPVGYLHLKRLQQMLQKKNAYSLSNTSRSLKTNQVSGEDRIARISNMESSALKAIGSDSILKELMGPRSDSSDAKNEMFKQISMY